MTKSSTFTLAPTGPSLDAEMIANKAVADAPAGASMEQLEAAITNALRQTIDAQSAKQPVVEILLLTVPQVAQALQTSARLVWRMINDGRLESINLGDLRRVPLDAVRRLAAVGTN